MRQYREPMNSSAAGPRWQRWWVAPRLRDGLCVLLSVLLAFAAAAGLVWLAARARRAGAGAAALIAVD